MQILALSLGDSVAFRSLLWEQTGGTECKGGCLSLRVRGDGAGGCRHGLGWGKGGSRIYSLHSWFSSSPWAQSRWKSQACPSWRTVPFQQVKELCKAILEPGDVPGEHTETHAPGQFRWPCGKAQG